MQCFQKVVCNSRRQMSSVWSNELKSLIKTYENKLQQQEYVFPTICNTKNLYLVLNGSECLFNRESRTSAVITLNYFPHIDAFWHLCGRQLFENVVKKEEIAQNEQFLLLPQCFPLLVIGYPFNYRDFLFFDKICLKLSAAELLYEGKG